MHQANGYTLQVLRMRYLSLSHTASLGACARATCTGGPPCSAPAQQAVAHRALDQHMRDCLLHLRTQRFSEERMRSWHLLFGASVHSVDEPEEPVLHVVVLCMLKFGC